MVHTDNEALSWMRRHPRQLQRIGKWLLRLLPFKFKVVHIRGSENVVTGCLSRMFEPVDSPTAGPSVRVLQPLPALSETVKYHQSKDPYCIGFHQRIAAGDTSETVPWPSSVSSATSKMTKGSGPGSSITDDLELFP